LKNNDVNPFIKSLMEDCTVQEKKHKSHAHPEAKFDNMTHIGNPIVNVNVTGCCGETKHDKKQKEDKKHQSAFRAIKNTPTPIPAAFTNFRVSFNNEQFDLNNEYNSVTSLFTAEEAGVYLFTATLLFNPNNDNIDYEFVVQLRINGVGAIDLDGDYTGFNAAFTNIVDLSEILRLEAGDTVEVIALSTTPGVVIAEPRASFAGARLV
jgi:hypothetical protein